MLTHYDILDYQDYLDEHEDYLHLMEEYSHTEIFIEIIHFMDIAFPEWITNKGVGFWAAEFVLTSIQNFEHLYEQPDFSSFEILKELYLNLVAEYRNSKISFSYVVKNAILDDFDIAHGEYLEENEHLPEHDFDALYKDLFNTYEEKYMEKIIYDFRLEELPTDN